MSIRRRLHTIAATALLSQPLLASATNGYFAHGYGMQSLGMAGTAIALPQDSLAAASNPAGTGLVGHRLDLGLSYFAPRRAARIEGNAFGPDDHYNGDGRRSFYIPEMGFTRPLNAQWGVGLALYGNGGMNTSYERNPYERFGASGRAGIDLKQVFFSPSVAWKPTDDHTLGAALVLAHQRFSAQGIGFFGGFSAAPDRVSDQGTDTSHGLGLRLGWIGQISPEWRVGLTWASKIDGRFDRYRGLFADRGGFDIPENYGLGVAYNPTPRWTLAADVQRILYSQVGSVGNPASRLFEQGVPLGSNDGPGFGWRDVTVVKLGVQHQLNDHWTLRAGYSHVTQPVPARETFFNILAPGVGQHHLTLGATWQSPWGFKLTGYAAHAFSKTVKGQNAIPEGLPPAGFGGGNPDIRLRENILGLGLGWSW